MYPSYPTRGPNDGSRPAPDPDATLFTDLEESTLVVTAATALDPEPITESDVERVIHWAHSVPVNAAMVYGVLEGNMLPVGIDPENKPLWYYAEAILEPAALQEHRAQLLSIGIGEPAQPEGNDRWEAYVDSDWRLTPTGRAKLRSAALVGMESAWDGDPRVARFLEWVEGVLHAEQQLAEVLAGEALLVVRGAEVGIRSCDLLSPTKLAMHHARLERIAEEYG